MLRTAVAGTGGTVPAGTFEGDIIRAGLGTETTMPAFFVTGTFQGKGTFVGEVTVEPDLLADGRLVLADSPCDGRFCRTIADTGLGDPAFIQSEGFVFVVRHKNLNLLSNL